LFQIDSLLLQDDYSGALHAYREQIDEADRLENNPVELRIAVTNKFAALNEGFSGLTNNDVDKAIMDSMEMANSSTSKTLRRVDSLQFALEKTKVQLARLKRQFSEKASGKYLTFNTTKGTEVHYVGDVKKNMANGRGLALLSTGSRYEGEWKDNVRHGDGTFFWPDGEYYVGEYKNDKRSGQGTYYWPNGEKFVGAWKNDERTGEGTFFGKDGKVIKGTWEDDKLVETHKEQKNDDTDSEVVNSEN